MGPRPAIAAALAAAVVALPLAVCTRAPAAVCPLGLSHRGLGTTGSPSENSLGAFRAAWESGIRWIKTDVRFTADGVPVIMHDDTVDRTTDGAGAVGDMKAEAFRALRLADGQHPPTLAEAINLTGPDRRIVLEIKHWLTPTQERALLAQIAGQEDRLRVSGFSYIAGNLQRLKAADPTLNTSLLTPTPVAPPAWSDTVDVQLTPALGAGQVADLHRAGVTVGIWLPDSVTGWQQARDLGADIITTNKANRYMEWVRAGCV